jgi:hypothetical protein
VPPAGHREDLRRADQPYPEAGHPQGTQLVLRGVRLDVELHADGLGPLAEEPFEFPLATGHGAAPDEGHREAVHGPRVFVGEDHRHADLPQPDDVAGQSLNDHVLLPAGT